MKELLGVVVLSMPILAVLCIGGLAGYAGWAAARRMIEAKKKWMARLIAAAAVVAIFTWDEIAGRSYFYYLCSTKGGAKVFKQISLPSEYWRSDGTPIFLNDRSDLIRSKLGELYMFTPQSDEHYSDFFRIRKQVYPVVERRSQEVLGTYTLFSYFGGWLVNYTSLDVAGIGCRAESNFYAPYLLSIFVPEQRSALQR